MNRIKVLYDVTKQLEKVIDQPITPTNREAVINQMNELIEQRSILMQKIGEDSTFTKEEKITGQQVVVLNDRIKKQMNVLFEELKQEMQQVKKQKKSNKSYTNPYKNIQSMDGMFLDRKQ